jgi:GDP-L-fucose synthase
MILVTGYTGFLGTNLIRKFNEQELSWYGPLSSEYNLIGQNATRRLFSNIKPKTVIHLAGTVGGIGGNQKRPGTYFYDNMQMGLNVIHQSMLNKVEKLILLGSICSYPKYTEIPFKEKDLWDGYPEETNAPYGVAKRALIEMSKAYYKQYGLLTINLLPVNMFGKMDYFEGEDNHVIPALIKKFDTAIKNDDCTVELWGTGKPTREFLYVEDCCDAIIAAVKHGKNPEPINVGTGQEISIKDLSELIAYKMGYTGRILWNQNKPDGQPRRCLDITRAYKELGFVAKTTLSDGLNKTIKWYKENAV